MDSSQSPSLARRLLRIKKRWWAFLLLAVFLTPYFWYRTTAQSRVLSTTVLTNPAAQFGGRLKIVTWNIAHGRGATDNNWEEGRAPKLSRIHEIAAVIESQDADIVLLNEVDFDATWSGGVDQAETIAGLTGFPYLLKQANLDFGFPMIRWHFGNALLSRFPISAANAIELSPVNDWEPWVVGKKRGFQCEIELGPQHSLALIGLHMESRNEDVRVRQATDIVNSAETIPTDLPLVLLGDLNTTPGEFPKSQLSDSGENAFEKLTGELKLSYSPQNAPSPSALTYSAMNPKSVIDWILYRSGKGEKNAIQQVEQRVVESQLSDHFPVVATFEWKPQPADQSN